MSVPTFPCPSGETCFAPECCAHGTCMHLAEAEQQQSEPAAAPEPTDTEIKNERSRLQNFCRSLALKPKRTCYTLHRCALCTHDITIGQEYRGDRTDHRAHEECFLAVNKEVNRGQ